jgi:hypothetical protein
VAVVSATRRRRAGRPSANPRSFADPAARRQRRQHGITDGPIRALRVRPRAAKDDEADRRQRVEAERGEDGHRHEGPADGADEHPGGGRADATPVMPT